MIASSRRVSRQRGVTLFGLLFWAIDRRLPGTHRHAGAAGAQRILHDQAGGQQDRHRRR